MEDACHLYLIALIKVVKGRVSPKHYTNSDIYLGTEMIRIQLYILHTKPSCVVFDFGWVLLELLQLIIN